MTDPVAGSSPLIRSPHHARRRDSVRWQLAVAVGALAGALVAVWVTLPADFLRYPAWLAAQKADFVVGPALTGLYWLRRRPQSPFGLMLIGWGLVGVLYPSVVEQQLAVHNRPVLGEGLRARDLRPHPGVPHGAPGPPIKDPADRGRPHRAGLLHRDPAPVASAWRGGIDLQLPVAVSAQRALA